MIEAGLLAVGNRGESMPRYEFECRACGKASAYLLPDHLYMNLKVAACGWCDAKALSLVQYHRTADDYIAQLQEQIEDLKGKLEGLDPDGETIDTDPVKQ